MNVTMMKRHLIQSAWKKLFRQSHCDTTSKGVTYKTFKEARRHLEVLTSAQKLFSERQTDRSSKKLATDQSELPVKKMADSYQETYLLLENDLHLREKYINHNKDMRFGKLLEDLDIFAVLISYKHNEDVNEKLSHLSIVTAMVDKIDLSGDRISPERDIKFTGNVTWVGKTSMEVTVQVDQRGKSAWKNIIEAQFLMAARDPTTNGPALISPLKPEGSREEVLFTQGKKNKLERQNQKDMSLLKIPPDKEEGLLIHKLFKQTIDPCSGTFRMRVKPSNSVWMEDALLKTVIVCHPQKRNLYGKIFGGYLMRQAFELAWATANMYSKSFPAVIAVDDILFSKPVEIGSLLFISSQITYTEGPHVQVRVHVEVVRPNTGTHETSNICHFTFLTTGGADVPKVIPKTYIESMIFLDGRRHFVEAMQEARRARNTHL